MKNKQYMDTQTGELVVGAILPVGTGDKYKLTDLRKMDTYRRSTEQGAELQKFNDSVGKNYTFSLKESVNELFSNELFNDVERVTIMYISSFVNFKGYLMSHNNLPMDKKLMKKYVKITDKYNAFNIFYNKLIDQGILVEENDKLIWDSNLCFKGTPKIYGVKTTELYRTYDKTLQELYDSNRPKSLTVVFRLLPYINRATNELCRVTDTHEYSEDDLYSPQEVAELLGITDSMDKKNFVRRALKVKIGNEFVFMVSRVNDKAKVMVNPGLVWMNSVAPHHTMTNLFKLAKK